jgi:ABC-type antimicrobial peptide transport system permease subunit
LLIDGQWCDADSCGLLHFLVRRLAEAKVLWCATYTVGEVERDAPAARLNRALRAGRDASFVSLAPLSEDEIWQMVRELDANVPMFNLRTVEDQVNTSLLNERLVATLSSAFGVLATLLAVIGLYGVMAYAVARRTREIGVRMALGAVPGDVLWLVMREVLALVGAGLLLGLAGAVALSRFVASQLYGVTSNDPTTILVAVVTLSLAAVIAGYVPAWRATRVNPVVALRYE